jgi:hypothetical protein
MALLLRSRRFRATLLLGLLVVSSLLVAQSAHNGLTRTSPGASSKMMLLAAGTTAANSSSSINLNGIWEDAENPNITFQVQETCTSSSSCQVLATYVTDPECPSAVGTTFLTRTTISGNPLFVGNDTMLRCTPADNAIVENCSQPAIWDTTFNATFTNSSIAGQYIDQYWTWNTTSDDLITDCRIEYTFANSFTLTRVPTSSTSTYSPVSSSTSQQNSGPTGSGSQGSSGSSSSKSTNSSTTSNSTSTTTSKSGARPIALIYYAAAAVVLVVAAGTSVILLRKKP